MSKLNVNATGFQHSVDPTFAMTGLVPVAAYAWNPTRGVQVSPQHIVAGGGLFDVHSFANYVNPFCTTVFISMDSGVAWSIFMTSGLNDGNATTLDDPASDVPIANGTGSALALVNRELLKSQRIRVLVGSSAIKPILVIANFVATATSGGRLIA